MSSQTAPSTPAAAPQPRPVWRTRRLSVEGGFSVALFETGSADWDAPAIVLVHGMGHDTPAAWNAVAAAFAPTHRIVAFDLPGFGASDKPKVRYTLAFFTTVLEAVVRDARLHDFALAGHSLGGLIAADFAARHPDAVRALALIAPAGFLRTPALALRIMGSGPVVSLMNVVKPTRGFVSRTLDRAVFDPGSIAREDRDRVVGRAMEPDVARAFSSVYAGAMHEMVHMRALHERLGAWRKPTLLVWGRQDNYIPVRALATAHTVYPQADVLDIDRCGHCPSIEYPELVVARMRANGF